MRNQHTCLFLLFISCLALSCKKQITTEFITIPSTKLRTVDSIAAGPSRLITVIDSFDSLIGSELSQYNLSNSDILSIEITKMDWILDSECTLPDFQVIKDSIKVHMANYGGNMPPLVAYKHEPTTSGKKIIFDVTKADLKYYFQHKYLQYIIQFTSNDMVGVTAGSTLKTYVEYKVNFQRRHLN